MLEDKWSYFKILFLLSWVQGTILTVGNIVIDI